MLSSYLAVIVLLVFHVFNGASVICGSGFQLFLPFRSRYIDVSSFIVGILFTRSLLRVEFRNSQSESSTLLSLFFVGSTSLSSSSGCAFRRAS